MTALDGMGDDELRELLALAAVGALDDEERGALDAAIASRPDLQAELAELEDAAAALGDATAEAPPPGLRGAVMASVEDVAQLPPSVTPAAPDDGVVVGLATGRRRRRWMPVAAAAAAVAVLAGALVAVVGGDDDGGGEVAAVVEADDAVTTELTGDLAGLRLVYSADRQAAALVGEGVPEPTGDDVYELWRIVDTPERMDIFRPDDDGRVELYLPDPAVTEDADVRRDRRTARRLGRPHAADRRLDPDTLPSEGFAASEGLPHGIPPPNPRMTGNPRVRSVADDGESRTATAARRAGARPPPSASSRWMAMSATLTSSVAPRPPWCRRRA